jgi:hypothetical protein
MFHDWWDKIVIPIVAMNWHTNEKKSKSPLRLPQQARPSDSKQLPCNRLLQLLAVIRGHVYREVTSQVAISDPTTANASILFEMLHGHLCSTKTMLWREKVVVPRFRVMSY